MSAAFAYDYAVPLGFDLLEVRGREVQIGDTLVADGTIPTHITDVSAAVLGFVSVSYDGVAGAGHRILGAEQRVNVLRAKPEAGH